MWFKRVHAVAEMAKGPFGLIFAFLTVLTFYKYTIFVDNFHFTKHQVDMVYQANGIDRMTGQFALYWLLISVLSAITNTPKFDDFK